MTDEELYARLGEFITDNKRSLFDRLAPLRTRHITAVLEDIYQPHNASAVVRTCDLLGIQDLHIIENRNKYTVNPDVTLGSSKWTTMHRYRGTGGNSARCVKRLKEMGYAIVVTSPRAENTTPESVPLDRPMAFCFGTELTGASDELIAAADIHLRIPMFGFTESYNISVSAAITLYTVMQRLRGSTIPWSLDGAAQLELKLQWARKVVHRADHLEARIRKEYDDPGASAVDAK
ncbi:MAG: RNA methyltransferase [Flavobacteriales bacterium]|nr:RNA methyltransferase [Flavobacteriales bacterium]